MWKRQGGCIVQLASTAAQLPSVHTRISGLGGREGEVDDDAAMIQRTQDSRTAPENWRISVCLKGDSA